MSALWTVMAVTGCTWWAFFLLVAVLLAVTQVTGRRRPRKRAAPPLVTDDALPLFFTRVPTADEIGAEAEQMLREYGGNG